MVKVSFQNYKQKIGISSLQPMYACMAQVAEIFDGLPSNDGSFIVVINDQNIKIKISGYSKYVWRIDIPVIKKQGAYQMFLSKEKCLYFIQQVFEGASPLEMNGLSFERFS